MQITYVTYSKFYLHPELAVTVANICTRGRNSNQMYMSSDLPPHTIQTVESHIGRV